MLFLLLLLPMAAMALVVQHSVRMSTDVPSPSRRDFVRLGFASLSIAGGRAVWAEDGGTAEVNRQLLSNGVNPFNSACMGFGCADANGLDYGGAAKPEGDSISFQDFLKLVDEKKVASVEFTPPNGDIAFAILKDDATKIRIGEGFPNEQNFGWSSPMYVMRILDNKGVPYKFKFEKMPYRGSKAVPPLYVPPARSSKEFIPIQP